MYLGVGSPLTRAVNVTVRPLTTVMGSNSCINLGFSPIIGSRISVSLVGFDGSPSPARFSARTRNSYLCPVCKDRIFVVVP